MDLALVSGPVLRCEKSEGTLVARIFPWHFRVLLVLVNRQAVKCLEVLFTYFAHQRLRVFLCDMAIQVPLVKTKLLTRLKATSDSSHQMLASYVPLQVARIVENLLTLGALEWSQISVNLSNVPFPIFNKTEGPFTKFTFEFCAIMDSFNMPITYAGIVV